MTSQPVWNLHLSIAIFDWLAAEEGFLGLTWSLSTHPYQSQYPEGIITVWNLHSNRTRVAIFDWLAAEQDFLGLTWSLGSHPYQSQYLEGIITVWNLHSSRTRVAIFD